MWAAVRRGNGCLTAGRDARMLESDVWVQQRDRPFEVTVPCGIQEGVDDDSVTGGVGGGNLGRLPHPPTGAAGELAGRMRYNTDALRGRSHSLLDQVSRYFGEGVTQGLSCRSEALFAQVGEQDSA